MSALLGALTALVPPGTASADTYHAGDGASLQAAVAKADASSGSSTIDVTAGAFLPTSTLKIARDITIVGPGSAPAAKLAGSAVVPSPSDLFIVEAHGALTLLNVELTGSGGDGYAAIDDYGAVDLESSTVAGDVGPGLFVQHGAVATVRNSTLADGLDFGVLDDGAASFFNSTVAFNKNGGIENKGTLNLTNTIVAENTGSGDCEGRANTSDHSLDSDGSCGVGALSRVDPDLGRLMENGGPTTTLALEAGSPAIGAGDDSKCPSEDQRHFVRPRKSCDIGAYQSDALQGAGQPAPGTGPGSGRAPGGGGATVGVSGHGTLSAKVAFAIRAQVGQARATFRFTDRSRHLVLGELKLRSLAIDTARGVATLRGSAVKMPSRRRVSVTVVLVSHAGHRSLRIQLSNGYYRSGRLLSGAIGFLRDAG
jgi:hypothetical protein